MKTIIITGGAGFIGTWLSEKLIKEYKIIIYDNLYRNSFQYSNLVNSKKLTFINANILNKKKLTESTKNANIFIHLAAIAGVSSYFQNPQKTLETNLIGTYNALHAAAKNNIDLFVYFSSSEVYGTHAQNAKEDNSTFIGSPKDSRWSYAISKISSEHLVYAFYKKNQLPIVILRPFNIYGPRQTGEGAIANFAKNAIKQKDLQINGKGNQIRAWCYVSDLTEAVHRCLKTRKAIGEIFNIGNPKEKVNTLSLAKLTINLSKSNSKIIHQKPLAQEIFNRSPNIVKAKKILQFNPKVSLTEGLIKSLAWYKSNY